MTIEAKEFEIYTNNCNLENLLITLLILRNRSFAIMIFIKNIIMIINYAKKLNNKDFAISEKLNADVSK